LTSIQAEIEAKVLYAALKAVGQVLDEVRLSFTPEGLQVRELDMAEISMVDLSVPVGSFDRYELFVENGAEVQRHVVAVRISDILKLFKRPKKDDRVTLLNRAEENMLTVALRGEKNFTFKVPVFAPGDSRKACRWKLEDESKLCPHGNAAKTTRSPSDRLCSGCEFLKEEYIIKELPMPKVNLTESFTAKTKAVADFLGGAKNITDSAYFKTEQYGAEVALEARGEISNVSQSLRIDDGTLVSCELKNAVRVAYDITRLVKLFQRDFGETVLVELAHELPLRVTYTLNGKDLFRDKPQLVYYVAPKVGYDEPPTPKVEEQKPAEAKPPEPQMEPEEPVATTTLPSELEQAKEIVKEILGPAEHKVKAYACENCGSDIPEGTGKRLEDGDTWLCDACVNDEKVKYYYGKRMPKPEEPKPEPVPVVAVDPLEAFRKKFAKKT